MNQAAKLITFAVAVFLLAGCGKSDNSASNGTGATTQASSGQLTIAVIPKGSTHSYWKSVRAGADQAGKELNVTIDWQGPVKENDRSDQIAMVQQFVAQGVNGIVLAPLDFDGLAAPVSQAMEKNIPVVIIDSSLKGTVGKDYTAFVATNNHDAGFSGGEQLAKILGGKGKVVLLRYSPGSASTEQREAGFMDSMAKHPDIKVISSDQFGGATADEAQRVSLNLLDKLQQADGIFTPNESTTIGMLNALEKAQLAGKVKFVGFDATPNLLDAMRAKEIDALVVQNPRKMGYEGVKACVAAVKKENVTLTTDTGSALVTAENLDTPDIKTILGN